jgi:hypothetical protein
MHITTGMNLCISHCNRANEQGRRFDSGSGGVTVPRRTGALFEPWLPNRTVGGY